MSRDNSSQKSSSPPPVYFLEPTTALTREHLIYAKMRKESEGRYEQIEVEEIKKNLKSIREENVANIKENIEKFQSQLEERDIKSFYAKTASDAAKYIEEILRESDLDIVCINNSSTAREAVLEIGDGIKIMDSYNPNIIRDEDTSSLKYWELPELSNAQIWNSFDVFRPKNKERYDFAALLGVNVASINTGSFFFVQHFNNISNLVERAKKTILVVSIEKLVKDDEQAVFISKSAGLFGLKSLLLDISSSGTEYERISIDEIAAQYKKDEIVSGDVHVVLLDNGRKDLLGSEFEEFLQCINCRACGAVCPRSLLLKEEQYRTPRELVRLRFTLGLKEAVNQGLYNCSLCGGCKIACPLLIPLPDFLQKIREQVGKSDLVPEKHGKLGENIRNYGNPYGKGDDTDKK